MIVLSNGYMSKNDTCEFCTELVGKKKKKNPVPFSSLSVYHCDLETTLSCKHRATISKQPRSLSHHMEGSSCGEALRTELNDVCQNTFFVAQKC